jgi:hypothetical protein
MKKLITLLSIPVLALGLSRCVPQEPVKEEYNKGFAITGLGASSNAMIKDIDKDGLADVIYSDNGTVEFYAKGYEDKVGFVKNYSIEMTLELRKYASDFIKADNNLRYEVAKAQYEQYNNLYPSADVKTEKINPFLSPFPSISDSTWNSMKKEQRDSTSREKLKELNEAGQRH